MRKIVMFAICLVSAVSATAQYPRSNYSRPQYGYQPGATYYGRRYNGGGPNSFNYGYQFYTPYPYQVYSRELGIIPRHFPKSNRPVYPGYIR